VALHVAVRGFPLPEVPRAPAGGTALPRRLCRCASSNGFRHEAAGCTRCCTNGWAAANSFTENWHVLLGEEDAGDHDYTVTTPYGSLRQLVAADASDETLEDVVLASVHALVDRDKRRTPRSAGEDRDHMRDVFAGAGAPVSVRDTRLT
jgi:hypothetical protein